ncbi:hypothetical protein ACWGI1_00280 [Streptomyces sp. NPDC054835]|uniref:hypothetical protein n=1 Tax=Streptomyces exfoliatus TaxID=1905 RepID=UPI0004B6CCED|nr:hypothetical protein [Streptomyces exfoliatus]
MDKTPGPVFLATVRPLLLESQQLTKQLVAALLILSASDYTTVPGSRSTVDTLASAVGSAGLVTTHFTQAIASNPLDGINSPGLPADERAISRARRADAVADIEECLDNALHDLGTAATSCSYAASAIVRDLDRAEASMPLPRLNAKQLAALEALAQGEGVQRIIRGGGVRILAADGAPVHPVTFAFFEKHRLVHVDRGTTISQGQTVAVTNRAHQLLAQPRPTAPTVRPAPAVRPTALAGRTR